MRVRIVAGLLSVIGVFLSSGGLAIVASTTLSDFLRYWGLALQLAGFVTVAWGLVELRQRFSDLPGLVALLQRRLRHAGVRAAAFGRKIFRRPRHQVVHAGDIASSVDFGDATVTVTDGPLGADLPVEERLAWLDQRTRQLREDFNRLQREIGAEAHTRKLADAEESAARTSAIGDVDRRLADLAVGGLTMEAWGVAMFVIGTILGALPDELANWLGAMSG